MLNHTCVCPHTEDARALVSTWCTPELEKAVELGYEFMRIYEVWLFPEKQEGLFKDYVNQWLKFKQEASGGRSGLAMIKRRDNNTSGTTKREKASSWGITRSKRIQD